jgi:hypothetical protein
LTVDPENHFVGINSNDRFANYSLKHTSEALGSIYDTSQHLYVKNDRYPNATFARIAENADTTTGERDYDATKDYTLFGTYSSATMLRCSEMWTYEESLQQAEHYTTSLAAINTTDWQKKKRYGPDIAFEIKDVSGVTTELGEIQMVIDSIDLAGNLHGGFGVQVVDRTLGTIFPQALKNIMYVNNESELFVNGVMLGGKLFKSDGVDLFWGDKKVKFESESAGSSSTGSSSTEILPVAYAYVNSQNYNATDANDRRGVNISWGQWNDSTSRHVFTFDTAMDNADYNVVTDRNYETTNAIHIFGKSTTGFTAEWDSGNPEVFDGTFIVYASTPTKTIGGAI